MRVLDLHIEASPRTSDFVRLSTEIRYQASSAGRERVWFDVPRTVMDEISLTGDPWLVALLPLAMVLQEPISLGRLPVDSRLLANLLRLMTIWNRWNPELDPVPIEADRLPPPTAAAPKKTASFFSGGVDSFYTLLYDRAKGGKTIDELILIHGSDIPIGNEIAFKNARAGVERVASELQTPLLSITTNLRSTLFRVAPWNEMSFGALLAAAALILEERYTSCLIPSAGRRGEVPPLGSHPETDPLFSTSKTRFIHHGAWIDRVGKTMMISDHPVALQNLRVCWESETGQNCGRCGKCLRTMATLEVLGKLGSCPAFEQEAALTSRLARQYLSRERPYMLDVRDFAAQRGRSDLVRAIDAAVRRTDRLNRLFLLNQIQPIRKHLSRNIAARRWMARPYGWLRRLGSLIIRLRR